MKHDHLKALLCALFGSVTAIAQTASTAPAFEVASIRPGIMGGNFVEVTPGAVVIHSATLVTCITWAYRLQSRQVSGADSAVSRLLDSERYDIVAKPGGLVPESQLKLMLQTLLADRFKLTLHRESRDMQAYALVVAKNGQKLGESQGEGESEQRASSKLVRQWTRTTMAQFADNLSGAMEAPVLDQTGLPGKYDFSLDLTRYMPVDSQPGERPDIASMMITGIQEQLGLKMESRRMQAEVLVIDHLQKPSEN